MASDSPGDPELADLQEDHQADTHPIAHHFVAEPADFSYRIAVRTLLWVIVGAVFVGFAVWWVMT